MDIGGKIWSLLGKRDNLIHIFLAGSFVALSIRSVSQQNDIQALQSEKEALQTTNKAMKKAMWDWKQQLFREATEDAAPPVPLSRLKAIYGDIPTVHHQQHQQQDVRGRFLLTLKSLGDTFFGETRPGRKSFAFWSGMKCANPTMKGVLIFAPWQ